MKYDEPLVDVVELEVTDVICTSTDDNFGNFDDILGGNN